MTDLFEKHNAFFASFDDPELSKQATESLEKDGYQIDGLYLSHPPENFRETDEDSGMLRKAAVWGGFSGLIVSMLIYFLVNNQILLVQGSHPVFAFIPLIPFVFVFIILMAALFTTFVFMIKSQLLPGQKSANYLKDKVPETYMVIAVYKSGEFEMFKNKATDQGAVECWEKLHIKQNRSTLIPVNQNT